MNDFLKIGRNALSILIGQWAVVGFALVDNAIAGHIDQSSLAALSIGGAIFMTVYVGILGVVQAILPIAGQLYGGQRYAEIGYQFRQSLYLAAGVSAFGIFCLLFPKPLFFIAGLEPEKEVMVRGYLNMLAVGFIPAVYFRIYASINQAISNPLFVTILQFVGLIAKVPLSWFLAIHMGMGITGCGLSSAIINAGFMLIAIIMLAKHPIYKKLELFKSFELPRMADQLSLLQLGIPMGLSNFIEVTGSTFMALFIARFNSDVFSAGHQLMVQLGAIVYQIPLSIGIAGSAVVAQYIGARKLVRARLAGFRCIMMGIIATIVVTLLVFTFRLEMLQSLTDQPDVLAFTTVLTVFIVAYQIADASQVVPAFVLRAYRVTVLPTMLYAISLWGLGLGGGYLIAFNITGLAPLYLQGPAGFWFGATVSLAASGIALFFLFNYVSKKRIQYAH